MCWSVKFWPKKKKKFYWVLLISYTWMCCLSSYSYSGVQKKKKKKLRCAYSALVKGDLWTWRYPDDLETRFENGICWTLSGQRTASGSSLYSEKGRSKSGEICTNAETMTSFQKYSQNINNTCLRLHGQPQSLLDSPQC